MSGSSSTGTGVGSVADMVSRIRAVMPASWFPLTSPDAAASATPVLDGMLCGIGEGWSFCHALTIFVGQQTRIATATGGFLDMICTDLFGTAIKRNTVEADAAFRSRIQANLLLPRATRAALSQTLLTLLGETPLIFEPSRAADTGGYGGAQSAAAGGCGGYGSPGLALGSSAMPFQFLISVIGATGWILRESQASYIDGNNLMQVAPRRVPRPLYSGGVVIGPMIEARGINLIKDSLGWTGCSMPVPGGVATWSVDLAGEGALLAAQPVLRLTAGGSGSFNGPAITLPLVAGPVVASLWIWTPAASPLQSLQLVISDQTGIYRTQIDLALTESWQRVAIGSFVPDSFTRSLSMQIVGQSLAAMTSPVLTQCWQIEAGSQATSYIPSSQQVGIREADGPVISPVATASTTDQTGLDEAIRRVIPAGSTAWTTLIV